MTLNQKFYDFLPSEGYFKVLFSAMASPCEFLVATEDEELAHQLAKLGTDEVRRIEQKFSRYRTDNLCYAINNANGALINIDSECFQLLTFAQTCYELSDGMFDLTSGVLRRVWTFDCGDTIPDQKAIDAVLPFVGWRYIRFDKDTLQMRPKMEIDFGGIGKEYAVSRVVELFNKIAPKVSALINLGGDIQITCARENQLPWLVGVESTESTSQPTQLLSMMRGGLATSGDSKRYLKKNGIRYSHILNPITGWPIANAPSSVTVVAPLCIQAGSLATLALLKGKGAESFLRDQNVQYWCSRS